MSTTFSDYAFYKAHGGALSEAVYNSVVDDAHAEILSQTNGRATTAPDAMQDAVKLCECKLVDTIAAYKEGAALLPKGIGSISNDGYSVAIGSGTANPLQAEAQERRVVCARYLQMPVNLMCRWL
ncbi:hypothetical protein LJC74_03135 [Eubacteriales bacterium OttesenSCG-928-A19]|nr:hypothetical protein [Eubacteriales bacterium OttesenSCG-928-A19]